MLYVEPFEPSAWMLGKMIDAAMAACDADIEQVRLAQEARQSRRVARAIAAKKRKSTVAGKE